jgi:hypothetical protein
MFPDFSVQTVEETLQKYSGFSWSSAGMGFAGACLTASFSESPNVAVACSLSDILESHVPQRYFLSAKAAKGILRRAEKRARTLPPTLLQALQALAMGGQVHGQFNSGTYWDGGQTSDTLDCSALAKGQMMPEKRRFPVVVSSPDRLPPMGTVGVQAVAQDGIVAVRTAFTGANGIGFLEDGTTHTLDATGGDAIAYDRIVGCLESRHAGGFQSAQSAARGHLIGTLGAGRRGTDVEAAAGGQYVSGTPVDANGVREFAGLPLGLDSARYRALGNAVTVHVAQWIAERIRDADQEEKKSVR